MEMAAYADIAIDDIPDEELILSFLNTGKAPNDEIADYVEKIHAGYYKMQQEMAMYDRLYFEPSL